MQVDTAVGDLASVELRAWLVTDLDLDARTEERIVEHLNELNAEWLYPKFVLYPHLGAITIEYDMFAGALNVDDFLSVLMQIGGMANDYDDDLKREFGGRRAVDMANDEFAATLAELGVLDEPGEPTAAPSGWRKFLPGSHGQVHGPKVGHAARRARRLRPGRRRGERHND